MFTIRFTCLGALIFALSQLPAFAAAPASGAVVAGHIAFLNGQVQVRNPGQAARALQNGAPVYVGDHIQTQNDSHLHLRMVDNAFVALRPASQLTIEAYDFNPNQPEASRIRLDLQHGSSRAVTGKGGQAAKHQYRFNTPLAAIGLRGTDYTVVADAEKTRVSVSQGGVIVSPLGFGCLSSQLGPCASPLARELTANMPNAFIEVTPNQPARVLNGTIVKANSTTVKAEATAEDAATRVDSQQSIDRVQQATQAALLAGEAKILTAPDISPRPSPIQHASLAQWGRWSALVKQIPEGSGSINSVIPQIPDYQIVGSNEAIALAYPAKVSAILPGQGLVQFSLVAAEAYTKQGGQFSRAGVKSGMLEMDFALNTFNTQLTVTSGLNRIESIQAQGKVDNYGRMKSDAMVSNSNVLGIVLNKGREATYLFDKTLTTGSALSGVAQWAR